MLLHLRVTVPADRTDAVRDLFDRCPGTAHLAVLPGVSVTPPGDMVLADVARESADALVAGLRALHVDRDGGITVEAVDTAVSTSAERAEEEAAGDGSDAASCGSRWCGRRRRTRRCRSPTRPSSRSRRSWPRWPSSTTRRSC